MAVLAQVVGALLVVAGVGLVSVAAALVVAGVGLLAVGVLAERPTPTIVGGE